jgi:hypothetical protein
MAIHLLLCITVVFCCTVGYTLSSNLASVWTLLIFVIAALVSLQTSYMIGVICHALSS